MPHKNHAFKIAVDVIPREGLAGTVALVFMQDLAD